MKYEHQNYILEQINYKTVPEIAKELGLSEEKVKKFLRKHNYKPPSAYKLNTPYLKWILLGLIIVLALA